MKLRTIKRAVRERIKEVRPGHRVKITKVTLWHWMLFTHHGKIPLRENDDHAGIEIFYASPFKDNPWAKRLASLRPNPSSPRVLVTGSRSNRDEAIIQNICRKHHLENVRYEHVMRGGNFWQCFYNAENFFSKDAEDIPSLIIMSGGDMKFYVPEGCWLGASERLTEVAKFYGIPIEQIPVED